jgi:hypothetical protein
MAVNGKLLVQLPVPLISYYLLTVIAKGKVALAYTPK